MSWYYNDVMKLVNSVNLERLSSNVRISFNDSGLQKVNIFQPTLTWQKDYYFNMKTLCLRVQPEICLQATHVLETLPKVCTLTFKDCQAALLSPTATILQKILIYTCRLAGSRKGFDLLARQPLVANSQWARAKFRHGSHLLSKYYKGAVTMEAVVSCN